LKQIHFIINPIAGSGKKTISHDLLLSYFSPKYFTLNLKYSNYKKHAIQLTQESIKEKADIIVACGGDGTINEVASCLVNSSIILGLIPIGSGNGLASNLQIPKNVEKAIQLIKTQTIKKIDVGHINNKYFFSSTGSGFDAKVTEYYEASGKRKLSSYVSASIKTLNTLRYEEKVEVKCNDEVISLYPFMIFVSNSNEVGYNVSLTPKASLQDGLLDVLIVPKLNKLRLLFFGLLTLIKKQYWLKEVSYYQTKAITLNRASDFQIQIDGELHNINTNKISVSILEASLSVIA